MKKCNLIALLVLCLTASIFLGGAAGESGAKGDFARTTIDLGIVVSDVEKAAQFYKNALGFTEVSGFDVSKEMGGDSGLSEYQAFHVRVLVLGDEASATKIKIMEFPEAPGKKVDNRFVHSSLGYSYLTIFVSDTTAAVERVKKAGVVPVKEPYQLGGGNFYLTLVKDPDGNVVELVGPKK
ncbi:MAG: VOC family protein [Planctomycetota bacterium]|jgi:catechol 2,3-dioxygenase-like lactoylglutathione lyase family enzyme